MPPCGSKLVFQRVTQHGFVVLLLCDGMCQHLPCRFVSDTFFEGACCVRFLQYCDISVFASLLDVHRSCYQTLECNGTVFCVHMQVVFISRLLASWAIISFLSSCVVALRVFREFDTGLCGCHGTI